MTVLPGFAPVYSARASAANHRESISPCRHDGLGVANENVTSKATDYAFPQNLLRPAGAPAESTNHRVTRVRSVRPLD